MLSRARLPMQRMASGALGEIRPPTLRTQQYYVPQIDSLRAFAVLAVLLYHLGGNLVPGGFSGVDVFFVISGYVVSSSLIRSSARSFRAFALQFYSKRILRIVPALLVCMFVTTLLTAAFIPNSWLSNANYTTLRLAMVGLGNFSLMFAGETYFSPRIDYNPAMHTWSLGVEEQFYLVFPAIYYLWLVRERGKNSAILGPLILPTIVVVSFLYSAYASVKNPVFAYYSLPSRFWELGLGGLLFQLHHRGKLLARTQTRAAVCIATSALLLFSAVVWSQATLFPVPWALAATIGSLLFIDAVVAFQSRRTWLMRALSADPLPWVGRISYSLYLWHWPVYVLFRWTVGLETGALKATAVLLVFLLSAMSYKFVELPLRHSTALLRRPPLMVVGAGIFSMLLGVGFAWTAMHASSELSLSVTRNTYDWYPWAWDLDDRSRSGKCPTTLQSRPIQGGTALEFARHGEGCGNGRRFKNLFVIGDSHATALLTALTKLALTERVHVRVYTKPNCAFLQIRNATASSECASFSRAFTDELRGLARPGDVVLLPSLRMDRLSNQWGAVPSTAADFFQGTREAEEWLASIADLPIRIVFVAPTPLFRAPAFRCSDWFNHHNPVCRPGLQIDRDSLQELRRPVIEVMQQLASRYSSVEIWDPFDRLCDEPRCSAFRSGRPLFFDGDHLSGFGNLVLYDSFRRIIR
jgi:peptidoglycan/LPS O-acetylase OafA/YrhL